MYWWINHIQYIILVTNNWFQCIYRNIIALITFRNIGLWERCRSSFYRTVRTQKASAPHCEAKESKTTCTAKRKSEVQRVSHISIPKREHCDKMWETKSATKMQYKTKKLCDRDSTTLQCKKKMQCNTESATSWSKRAMVQHKKQQVQVRAPWHKSRVWQR